MLSEDSRPTRRDWLISAGFLLILLWVNLYVCRSLFTIPVAATNSMHGAWTTIGRWAAHDWFQSNWWPWWDNGIPFEFTYSPLVPGLTAALSSVLHTTRLLAMQSVTGIAYCLGPMTLYLMAWLLTGAPVYSFLAALAYSLYSPGELLASSGPVNWVQFYDARRLFMTTMWDDTPHLVALALLPLAILFLARAMQQRSLGCKGLGYGAAAAVTIALMTFASTFGPVIAAIAVVCLTLALRPRWPALLLVGATGIYAYALCARFLTPSLLHAARIAAQNDACTWNSNSWIALTCLIGGIALLWFVSRRIADANLRFMILFAWITVTIPVFGAHWNSRLLPQSERYEFEAEMALALMGAFGLRAALKKTPSAVKVVLLGVFLICCYTQIKSDRRQARKWTTAGDLTSTIEYRAALWVDHNLPGVRVYLPGSMNKWAGEFAELQQYSGGSWSEAYNRMQQFGIEMVDWGAATPEDHRRLVLPWIRAYGVGALCVNGPKSPEYWPNVHPLQLEGIYPALWHEDDTTIYRVPQRTPGFAHIVAESAILRTAPRAPNDTSGIEKYVAGLDDASFPAATFAWEGVNRIHIHTDAHPDQALSVQVSWHPGWHATVAGKTIDVMKDGLGLMWMRPHCNSVCDVELDYDGGWELRIFRWLGYVAWAGILLFIGRAALARPGRTPRSALQSPRTTKLPALHQRSI